MSLFSFLLMAPKDAGGSGSIISTLIMFGIIAGVVYLFNRSSRKKRPNIKRVKRKTDDKNTV